MRICLLTHTFPRFNGDSISSIFMAEVAQSLIDAGNDVWVLAPFSPRFKKTKTDYKVVTYKYIFPKSLHILGYSETLTNDMGLPFAMWLLSPLMYFFGFVALVKIIWKEKIDLISAHWILPNGFIAAVASLFTLTPVVTTLPGSDVYMAKKNWLFNIMARFAVWRSRWITSNSPQLISDLEAATKTDLGDKSSIIPYGIGSNKFKPDSDLGNRTRRRHGFQSKDIVVLGVGRLVSKKGFRYLIEASKEIIKRHPNTYFVLIGDGEERISLENLAEELKVMDNFRFLGAISYTKLNSYYNMADIFILPSTRDERGNLDDQSVAVVDAMICSKPVITTDFPGYRLIIKDGENGYLTQEKDQGQISLKLEKLISSKKLRTVIGEMARKTILNNFSWKKIGTSYATLFEGITQKNYSQGIKKILDIKGREKIARQIMGVLGNEIEYPKGLKLLDVGSSSGVISNYLADYFGRVTAIDSDEPALKIAQKAYIKKNLEFILMDAERMQFPDKSFDVVVCNQVYNFVAHPQKLVDEIYRVLKPGGKVFFSARNRWGLIEPQYNIPLGSWLPWLLPFGKNYMGFPELKELVRKFEIHDLTIEILKKPEKFGYFGLAKWKELSNLLPLKLFLPIIPNFIWILKKPETEITNLELERQHFNSLILKTGETYYGNLRPAGEVRFIRKAKKIISLLDKINDPKILEIGCGTGILSEYLLRLRPDLKIVGVDISDQAISVAQKKLLGYKNAKFITNDISKFLHNTRAFDAVIGNSILHHMNPTTVLAESLRALKPGGFIWFCEPNILNPQIFLEKKVSFFKSRMQDSPGETAFTKWYIKDVLRGVGFKNIKVVPFEFLHPLVPRSLLWFLVPFARALEKTPLIREFSGTLEISAYKNEKN